MIVDEAGHPKCRRGVISRHGEQQLVDFARKVGTIARRRDQTAFGIDADGNDNAATFLRAIADVANDLPARQAAALGEVVLQPFRKSRPCAALRDLDRGLRAGIAQAHKGEVKA